MLYKNNGGAVRRMRTSLWGREYQEFMQHLDAATRQVPRYVAA